MLLSHERKKGIFSIELHDQTMFELFLIWNFGNDTENWDFGIKYINICAKERIKMKHVVKMVAYIDTEETNLIELGKLGLEKIKKEIESGVCVVDVYKNCVSVEMVCVNINEKKEVENDKKREESK